MDSVKRASAHKPVGEDFTLDTGSKKTPPSSPESSARNVSQRHPQTIDWTKLVTIDCVDDNNNGQTFYLHRDFLVRHSAYYRSAFNGQFAEGHTQKLTQNPITLDSFAVFARWIYNTHSLEDAEGAVPSPEDLINVWIFADEKLIPRLQNQVIEVLNDEFGKRRELPVALFAHIYHRTMEGSSLRRLLVYHCLANLGREKIEEVNYPRAMLVDLLNASLELKSSKASKLSKDKLKSYFVEDDLPISRPKVWKRKLQLEFA